MQTDVIKESLLLLAETFRQKLSPVTIAGYRVGLKGLTNQQICNAVDVALQRCKFMPSPAELREFAEGGSDNDSAQIAWLEVVKAMPYGAYKSVSFNDPLINASIRSLGGWVQLFERCATSEGESYYRHAFMEAYSSFAKCGVSPEASKPLAGISVQTCIGGVLMQAKPICIGVCRNRDLVVAS